MTFVRLSGFTRINRWRKDKKPDDANTISGLKKMLEVYGK
jgi:DNA ligase 1